MNHNQHTGSVAAAIWGMIGTAVFGILPTLLASLAALTGMAWSLLMIYESASVQQWLRKRGSRWALDLPELEERHEREPE